MFKDSTGFKITLILIQLNNLNLIGGVLDKRAESHSKIAIGFVTKVDGI